MPRRPVKPALSYPTWKALALAELAEKHGITASSMREKEWRNLFIRGRAPGEAAEHAQRFHYNARLIGRRR